MTEHVLDRVDPVPDQRGARLPTSEAGAIAAGAAPVEMAEDRLHSEIAGAVLSVVRQFAGIKARLVDSAEGEMLLSILLAKVGEHGPLRAADLAHRISADPSTVSRQVAALVKVGWLERRADPEDGRASLLVVTDAGRARLAEHEARRGRATAPVLAGWSLHDRAELLRLVSRYAAGLREHRDEVVAVLAGAPAPAGPAPLIAGTPDPGTPGTDTSTAAAHPAAAPTRSTGTEEDR